MPTSSARSYSTTAVLIVLGSLVTTVGWTEELSAYYSLGFRPTSTEAGAYHTLTVRVAGDGTRIRHREGYRIRSSDSRMTDHTLSAALHGASRNPLGVMVATSRNLPREDGTFTVPLVIEVPLDQVALVPGATTHEGRLSVMVLVRDGEGRLSDFHRREYPVVIDNAQMLEAITQRAGFTMGLLMRAGPQVVAVGVRDELANLESTVTIDVTVGEASEQPEEEQELLAAVS